MTAFLLKTFDDPYYATVAGLKVVSEEIRPNSLAIVARGIFTGSAAEADVKRVALDGEPSRFELSFESGTRLRADLSIDRLEYCGDFNGERNYEIELRSVGPVETLQ